MGNHFHILVKMFPEHKSKDDDIQKRYEKFYGNDGVFTAGQIPSLREKLSSLSEFIREIKVGFTRYYNKSHNRRGYFWGDRFKSVIVENGETLINCLAYIDLNPLRAGLVKRPEDYRWNSIGYHLQTGNKDNFLSLDFRLVEFGVLDSEERLKYYRRYIYEAGAVDRSEKGQRKVIGDAVVKKRKEFVRKNYQRFKHLFHSKHEKKPKLIKGLDGMYSLKRLSEVI